MLYAFTYSIGAHVEEIPIQCRSFEFALHWKYSVISRQNLKLLLINKAFIFYICDIFSQENQKMDTI